MPRHYSRVVTHQELRHELRVMLRSIIRILRWHKKHRAMREVLQAVVKELER